jgi:hypothetical protein
LEIEDCCDTRDWSFWRDRNTFLATTTAELTGFLARNLRDLLWRFWKSDSNRLFSALYASALFAFAWSQRFAAAHRASWIRQRFFQISPSFLTNSSAKP